MHFKNHISWVTHIEAYRNMLEVPSIVCWRGTDPIQHFFRVNDLISNCMPNTWLHARTKQQNMQFLIGCAHMWMYINILVHSTCLVYICIMMRAGFTRFSTLQSLTCAYIMEGAHNSTHSTRYFSVIFTIWRFVGILCNKL